MIGTARSQETCEKIGKKNAINMRRYMQEHPDIAMQRAHEMREKLTPEIKIQRIEASRLAIANETVIQRAARSDHAKRLWDEGILNENIRQIAADTWKERHAAGEYDITFEIGREKISKAITQKYIDGSFNWAQGTHDSTKTGKSSCYRSSWELELMNILDTDFDVLDWESEFTVIMYQFENRNRRYIPDFHVTRQDCEQLIEVKPTSLRTLPKNVAKHDAAVLYCNQRGWQYIEWEPVRICL